MIRELASRGSMRFVRQCQQIAACDEKLKRIKDLKQGFVTEKRLIRDKALKAQYDTVRHALSLARLL
jgi:hypothetical protein